MGPIRNSRSSMSSSQLYQEHNLYTNPINSTFNSSNSSSHNISHGCYSSSTNNSINSSSNNSCSGCNLDNSKCIAFASPLPNNAYISSSTSANNNSEDVHEDWDIVSSIQDEYRAKKPPLRI